MADPIIIRKLPPVWFIRGLNFFRSGLLKLHRITFPANVVMYERFTSFWLLQAIRVAAELDIAGILKKGPLSIEQIAENTGSDREALSRMMRALASEHIFKKTRKGLYENTSLSRVLIGGKGSLRYMLLQHLGTLNWTLLNDLSYSIRSGKPVFTNVYGMNLYEYLSYHPEESALFDRSMTNLSEISIEPILNAVDFSRYPLIADIGGGEGLLLSSILHKHKKCRGILSDLPEALKNTELILTKFGVTGRVQVISGSFFNSAPAGADVYLLKNVIHNWSDEESIVILSNIRNVLPPHGKVLIAEMIIDEENHASFGKLIDLQMLVFMEKGKERTLKEFESLLAKAGLRLIRVIPTVAPISVIEASV